MDRLYITRDHHAGMKGIRQWTLTSEARGYLSLLREAEGGGWQRCKGGTVFPNVLALVDDMATRAGITKFVYDHKAETFAEVGP